MTWRERSQRSSSASRSLPLYRHRPSLAHAEFETSQVKSSRVRAPRGYVTAHAQTGCLCQRRRPPRQARLGRGGTRARRVAVSAHTCRTGRAAETRERSIVSLGEQRAHQQAADNCERAFPEVEGWRARASQQRAEAVRGLQPEVEGCRGARHVPPGVVKPGQVKSRTHGQKLVGSEESSQVKSSQVYPWTEVGWV
jgi:hypothetical protein